MNYSFVKTKEQKNWGEKELEETAIWCREVGWKQHADLSANFALGF